MEKNTTNIEKNKLWLTVFNTLKPVITSDHIRL